MVILFAFILTKRKHPIFRGVFQNLEIVLLVHQIDSKWHHIVPSLLAMHDKLVQLGFVYYSKEIRVFEPVERQKYVYGRSGGCYQSAMINRRLG
jgi:hypothetical protein